jgi:hypothetical protein
VCLAALQGSGVWSVGVVGSAARENEGEGQSEEETEFHGFLISIEGSARSPQGAMREECCRGYVNANGGTTPSGKLPGLKSNGMTSREIMNASPGTL